MRPLRILALVMAAVVAGAFPALATTNIALPFYEPFNYSLGVLGSSVATGSDVWGNAGKAEAAVVSGNLSYPGLLDSTGNKVAVTGGTANAFNDPRPQLASPVSGGTFYVSFLLRVRNTTGIGTASPGNAVIGITASSGSSRYGSVNLWNDSGTIKAGAVKWNGGTTVSSSTFFPGGIVANNTTTYFIVLKYEYVASTANDTVTVWLNPGSQYLGGTEDPGNKVVAGAGADGTGSLSRIYLELGHDVDIDEERAGTTWASVTPLGCLPPGAFAVTGGGYYNPGGGGVAVGLSGSETGVQYQLRANGMNHGVPVAGTGGALNFGLQTLEGSYTVVGSNTLTSCTAMMNGSVTVALNVPPTITTQPQSQNVPPGENVAFSSAASGTAPLSCQWYFNTNTLLAGATNWVLTITNAQATNAGAYWVVVTNVAGSVTSVVAHLTVQAATAPSVLVQPTNLAAYVGTTGAFTVQADGTAPLFYQWYFNTNTPLANATNTALTLTNIQPANAGTYSVRVTNRVGSAFSATATLTVVPVLAFPGAEGFGKYTVGGRGGDLYIVTSIADYASGASTPQKLGTFRYGLESMTGPRTIVFEVAGTIQLLQNLDYRNLTNLTIAGQTAPGKGITIKSLGKDTTFDGAHHLILRYLHFRSGPGNDTDSGDSITIEGGDTGHYVDHLMFDHCSMSWGVDGNFDARTIQNYTVQWCMFTEALNDSTHYKHQPHAMCTSQRGLIGNGCNHHNLYGSSRDRHPSFGGDETVTNAILDYRNCVVYNWGLSQSLHRSDTNITGNSDGFTRFFGCNYNIINNYYRRGTELGNDNPLSPRQDSTGSIQKAYFGGLKFTGYSTENDSWAQSRNSDFRNALDFSYYDGGRTEFYTHLLAQAIDLGEFTPQTHTADQAYELILLKGGASSLRDNPDAAFIRSVRNKTGIVIDTVEESVGGGWDNYPEEHRPANWDTDHDGIPNYWETAVGWNPNVPNNNHMNPDGDTDLEHYLNWLAEPHAVGGKNLSANVSMRTLYGDTNSLTFTVVSPTNGRVAMLPDGDVARFTPTANFTGLAGFDFYATNTATGVGFGPLSVGLLLTNSSFLPPTNAPPTLAVVGFTNGQFCLLVAGDSGPDYTIQASTNLSSWADQFTTNPGALPFLWTDAVATNYSQRFYRVLIK